MAHPWQLRCPAPTRLVFPVAPGTEDGPTPSQARFGGWRRIGHNAYVPADTDSDMVEQRILEQVFRIPGAVATSWAALRLHGANLCDGLASDGVTLLDVPLIGRQSARPRPGLDYRRLQLAEDEVTERHGIPCTTALRATVDAMCAAADLREAVMHGDVACSAGLVAKEELIVHLDQRRHTRGLGTARAAAALVSERVRSQGETSMRLIWSLDAGLPSPLCNWPVLTADGAWKGAPDLLSPELGIYGEYDGEGHRTSRQQAIDAARDTTFQDLGLEGFRVVGRDIHDRELVVARIRSAIARAQASGRPRLWRPGDRPKPLVQ